MMKRARRGHAAGKATAIAAALRGPQLCQPGELTARDQQSSSRCARQMSAEGSETCDHAVAH